MLADRSRPCFEPEVVNGLPRAAACDNVRAYTIRKALSMLSEIPVEQFAAAIDGCVREVLAEASIVAPPVDAMLLAERLGLVVVRDAAMDQRARFVRLGQPHRAGQGTILLADEERSERRQWAVAHEVGESIAYRVFDVLGVRLDEIPVAGRESVANHLASRLLLPSDWFAVDGRALGWDIAELKRFYVTASHELIARRLLDLPPAVIITLFDQGQVRWRRSNVVARPPQLTQPERETWQACSQSGKAARYCGRDLPVGIDDLRCWAVHESGWRREILRTGIEEQ